MRLYGQQPGYQQPYQPQDYGQQPGYQQPYQQPAYQQPAYSTPGPLVPYQQPGYQQPGYQQAVQPGLYTDPATGLAIPVGTQVASVGTRVGGYFLSVLFWFLASLTVEIAYLIWGAITWSNAQTPTQQVLSLRCWKIAEARPATWVEMLLRGVCEAVELEHHRRPRLLRHDAGEQGPPDAVRPHLRRGGAPRPEQGPRAATTVKATARLHRLSRNPLAVVPALLVRLSGR